MTAACGAVAWYASKLFADSPGPWIESSTISETPFFFLAHLAWAVYSVRFFTAREDKLEAAGKVVPGFAGVLMIAAALLASSGWSVLCAVLAFPLMIFGRAAYELIVFRKSGGDPAVH